MVTKKQLADMKFKSLSSSTSGDAEIFYALSQDEKDAQDQKEVVLVFKNAADHAINEYLPEGFSVPESPSYRTEIDRMLLRCDKNQFAIIKTEFWNASNQLVRLGTADPAIDVKFQEFKAPHPYAVLQRIVCPRDHASP
jgi:hypothetical protein